MSTLSKQQLGVENQTSFPNNTTGYITPVLLRTFNTNIIDSTVNQTIYNTDSSSVSAQLVGLNSYTQSLNTNFITSGSLNAATASLSASLTTTINTKLPTTTFNSFSSSLTASIVDLQTYKASLTTGNSFTGSQNIDGNITASGNLSATNITASNNIRAVGGISGSGLGIQGSTILGGNAFDVNTLKGFVNFTNPEKFNLGSINWLIYSASIFSSSVFNENVFVPFSQSAAYRLNSLEVWSSSLDTNYATDAELAAVSSSIMSTLNTFSSSQYKADSSSFDTRINTNSASFASFSSSAYKTDSSSFDSRINTEVSASTFFSGTQYINDSTSFDSRVDYIEARYATTGSNTFNGNQIVNGYLQVSSSATYDIDVTGSIQANSSMRVSSSVGIGQISTTLIQFQSGSSITAKIDKGGLQSVDGTNAPTEFKGIGLSANPSLTGISSLSSITSPALYANSASAAQYYAPIRFQAKSEWTDGRVTFVNPLIISSSTTISGSVNGRVGDLSVASNTASIDMSKGNFFTLNIPASSNTFITATNIKEGQTVAVKLTQGATTGSLSWASNFNFTSGSINAGTPVSNAVDVLTFVTFDSNDLWCSIAKNLV